MSSITQVMVMYLDIRFHRRMGREGRTNIEGIVIRYANVLSNNLQAAW